MLKLSSQKLVSLSDSCIADSYDPSIFFLLFILYLYFLIWINKEDILTYEDSEYKHKIHKQNTPNDYVSKSEKKATIYI